MNTNHPISNHSSVFVVATNDILQKKTYPKRQQLLEKLVMQTHLK